MKAIIHVYIKLFIFIQEVFGLFFFKLFVIL